MQDRAARFFAWLRTLPSPVKLGIVIAVAINIVLAGGYVWSRPGQTTHLRFEARDNTFTAFVDGHVHQIGQFDGPPQGGVMVAVEDTKALPSVPRPSGIDSVRITDLDTGELLYANDFSEPPPATGIDPSTGTLTVSGGVLEAQTPASVPGGAFSDLFMRIEGADWRNYAVDVTYRNITTGIIRLRSTADGSGVEFAVRPFRHLDSRLTLFRAGKGVDNRGGPAVEANTTETARSMVAMVLRSYPVILLLLVAGFGAVGILQFVPLRHRDRRRTRGQARLARAVSWFAVSVIAAGACALLVFYNYSYGSHMPHVPDEVFYLFQAKVLAAGHLAAPPPPVTDSFDLGDPPLIVVTNGKWASVYPFGHPLMLAIGVRFGAVWLIPPLIGAASIVLLFAIGRRLYNARIGMLAAVMLAASPFFLMNASNFMSHNTAAFYLLVSILCLAYADQRTVLFPFLAGLFVGLVFNTRPLSGMALSAPFGLLLLTFPLSKGRRAIGARQIAAFAAGAALMLLAYVAYRYGTTSHVFSSHGLPDQNAIGFGGAHSVSAGVENERTQLTFLVMMLSNWPVRIGIGFVLLPFILGTRNRWDWFFLGSIVALWGAYTAFFNSGFMYGPRYWYETTPLLLLLTARGAETAAQELADAAMRARSIISRAPSRPEWAGVAVVYVFVLVLTVTGWRSWAYASRAQWRTDFAPSRARDLRAFNGIDDHLVREVEAQHPKNALVLVGECPNWQCYGNVDWLNSPWLDSDVVYARDLPARNAELFRKFPDRDVYYARYAGGALLVPYAGVSIPIGASPVPDTPLRKAGSFPAPTVAVPTPVNPADAIARDEQRQLGLAKLAAALRQYHEQHGAYPMAPNIQTFCTYPGDAGCALKDLLDPLPSDPGPNATYWYLSDDGTHFTVFARLENAAPPSACPSPLPGHLPTLDHVYCVSG